MIEINFKGRRVRIRSSEARQLEYEEKIHDIRFYGTIVPSGIDAFYI